MLLQNRLDPFDPSDSWFSQEYQVILADTGEVIEFCDPRIQQIKATLEELFDIEVMHHSLNVYARKKPSAKHIE